MRGKDFYQLVLDCLNVAARLVVGVFLVEAVAYRATIVQVHNVVALAAPDVP